MSTLGGRRVVRGGQTDGSRFSRSSRACGSCAIGGSSSARSRSISSRCCSAARPRSCRPSPATSCTWDRLASALLRSAPAVGAARRRRAGPLAARAARGARMFVGGRALRRARRSSSASRQRRPLACRALRHSAPRTWSASSCARRCIQYATPDPMRGRVSAVNMLFIGASNELGEFESGLTAAWFGTVPAVVVGGLGTLGVVAVVDVALPEAADGRSPRRTRRRRRSRACTAKGAKSTKVDWYDRRAPAPVRRRIWSAREAHSSVNDFGSPLPGRSVDSRRSRQPPTRSLEFLLECSHHRAPCDVRTFGLAAYPQLKFETDGSIGAQVFPPRR